MNGLLWGLSINPTDRQWERQLPGAYTRAGPITCRHGWPSVPCWQQEEARCEGGDTAPTRGSFPKRPALWSRLLSFWGLPFGLLQSPMAEVPTRERGTLEEGKRSPHPSSLQWGLWMGSGPLLTPLKAEFG
jgi:hypothetical protein